MRFVSLFVCVFLAVAGGLLAQDIVPDCSAVSGWSQKNEVRTFEPDNLFDYMDGNAEGYIIYGFAKMTGVTCASGDQTILIDVSEMETPELAYGMFSANRHPRHEVVALGTAGQLMPRKATFVKGKYYVEFSANEDAAETLEAFARAVEPKVPGPTDLPGTLEWFPKENLDEGSARLVPQSVLGLRMLTRGYIAQYNDGRAFIVEEESPEAANAVMDKFRERLAGNTAADVGDEAVTGKDRYLGMMFVVRKGKYIVGTVTRKEGELESRATALAANVP